MANKWEPANQNIPISVTVTVKNGKQITVERFADGRETKVIVPAPKWYWGDPVHG